MAGKVCEFLHDNRLGVGVKGTRFKFEGIAYIYLELVTVDGTGHVLEYEPVLISSNISTNIYGIKTEERFKKCIKDYESSSIVFETKTGERLQISCLK